MKKRDAVKKGSLVLAWVAVCGLVLGVIAAVTFFGALKIEKRGSQVTVPDLVGMSREEASRAAASRGLVVDADRTRHDAMASSGTVLEQQPPAGASVRKGRKIRVTVSLGGEVLEVPDVVGRADRTGSIEIRREGLLPGHESFIPSRASPLGTVLAQVPPAGAPAVPGMRVHRLVSAGPDPERWVMPDLSGMPLERVETWILSAGFRKGAVRRLAVAGRSPGVIVGQLPLAGYPVKSRDAVDLTVTR